MQFSPVGEMVFSIFIIRPSAGLTATSEYSFRITEKRAGKPCQQQKVAVIQLSTAHINVENAKRKIIGNPSTDMPNEAFFIFTPS